MTDRSAPQDDPQLGRILYQFEPPSLYQMTAGLIGAAVGWFLFMALGDFLKKLTLGIAALGCVAFVIGLWRFSELVQFGERGVRRRKWGSARELLYAEIGAVTRAGSESAEKYSSLRIEPREPDRPTIQFYRFEDATFPQAESLMVSVVVEGFLQRLKRGESLEWLPGVRFHRAGLEVSTPTSAVQIIPYRDLGAWVGGNKGALTLRAKSGEPLVTTSLDGRNFIPCYQLLGKLMAEPL